MQLSRLDRLVRKTLARSAIRQRRVDVDGSSLDLDPGGTAARDIARSRRRRGARRHDAVLRGGEQPVVIASSQLAELVAGRRARGPRVSAASVP